MNTVYQVTRSYIGPFMWDICPVEVSRTDATNVWKVVRSSDGAIIREVHCLRRSVDQNYFDTEAEALDWVHGRVKEDLRAVESQAKRARATLDKIAVRLAELVPSRPVDEAQEAPDPVGAVYNKYSHLDQVLSHLEWCGDAAFPLSILRECWLAMKAHVEGREKEASRG